VPNISPKYQRTCKKNDFIGVISIREQKRLMKLPEKVGGINQFLVKSLHFSILRHIGKCYAVLVIRRLKITLCLSVVKDAILEKAKIQHAISRTGSHLWKK